MERIKSLWSYYFKPNSLTWLSGAASASLGVSVAIWPDQLIISTAGEVTAGLIGADASPASLILMGLGLMGIGARKGES